MRSPCSALLLVPVLLAGTTPAWAQAPTCQAGAPHLELTSEAVPPVEICIRPGQFTPFFFDMPLVGSAVVLEGREHFGRVEVSPQALLLAPSEQLPPGTRLQLEVRFADGQAPERARFTLVVHPEQFARQVEVSRAKPPAGPGPAQARRLEEELQRCEAQLADTSALASMPLSQAAARGAIDEKGLSVHLFFPEDFSQSPGEVHQVQRLTFYRTSTALALEVLLLNEAPAQPWRLEGAALLGPGGAVLPAKAVLTQAERLYMEWESRGPPKSFTLQLWDAGKARTITVRNLKLP